MMTMRVISSRPSPSVCAPKPARRSPAVAYTANPCNPCNPPMQRSFRQAQRFPGMMPFFPPGFGGFSRSRMQDMIRMMEKELQEIAPTHPFATGNLAVDIIDESEKIIFKADVPGLTREDVKVRIVENNLLTIEAERKNEYEEKKEDKGTYRFERSFGKIARSFHLPPYADLQSVKARVENGVLTIEVGKKPEEKVEPAGIDIQVE